MLQEMGLHAPGEMPEQTNRSRKARAAAAARLCTPSLRNKWRVWVLESSVYVMEYVIVNGYEPSTNGYEE